MDPREELRHKVSLLPTSPGVYLYKDAHGKIIYVGKAKSLRARVRSYFNEDRLADAKTGTLISEARDVDFIQVDNNKEALALENNLIKQYKPRYNILLRDDKTYPYIKLTGEKYPASIRDAPFAQGRRHVLRAVFSRQSGAPSRPLYPPIFQGAVVFGRFLAGFTKRRACSTTSIDASGPCVQGLTTDDGLCAGRPERPDVPGRPRTVI